MVDVFCNNCGHRNPDGLELLLVVRPAAGPQRRRRLDHASPSSSTPRRARTSCRSTSTTMPRRRDAWSSPAARTPGSLVRRSSNEVTTAGRHPDSDIFLDDITVSRRHVEIARTADGLRRPRRRLAERHLPEPGADRGGAPRPTATSSRSASSSWCSWLGSDDRMTTASGRPPLDRRGARAAAGGVPRRHDLQDPVPREPGPARPRAHAVGLPEVLRGRHRPAALDPHPAAGELPAAQGHQGPPRRGRRASRPTSRRRAGAELADDRSSPRQAARRRGGRCRTGADLPMADVPGPFRPRRPPWPLDRGQRLERRRRRSRDEPARRRPADGQPQRRASWPRRPASSRRRARASSSSSACSSAQPIGDDQSTTTATRSSSPRRRPAFLARGIEPRHLRMYKVAAEREAGFLEQVVMPLLKQRNPEARKQAIELLGRAVRARATTCGPRSCAPTSATTSRPDVARPAWRTARVDRRPEPSSSAICRAPRRGHRRRPPRRARGWSACSRARCCFLADLVRQHDRCPVAVDFARRVAPYDAGHGPDPAGQGPRPRRQRPSRRPRRPASWTPGSPSTTCSASCARRAPASVALCGLVDKRARRIVPVDRRLRRARGAGRVPHRLRPRLRRPLPQPPRPVGRRLAGCWPRIRTATSATSTGPDRPRRPRTSGPGSSGRVIRWSRWSSSECGSRCPAARRSLCCARSAAPSACSRSSSARPRPRPSRSPSRRSSRPGR